MPDHPQTTHEVGPSVTIASLLHQDPGGLDFRYRTGKNPEAVTLTLTQVVNGRTETITITSIPIGLKQFFDYLQDNLPELKTGTPPFVASDEELAQVINYLALQTRIAFTKELDEVRFWNKSPTGELTEAIARMPLVDVLGVVCQALMDEDPSIYPGEPGVRRRDKRDRLKTFYDAVKESISNPACSTGVRHALVMTLNGVYPDLSKAPDASGVRPKILLIENLDDYLIGLREQFLLTKITPFKAADPARYYQGMITWMREGSLEDGNSLKALLAETLPGTQTLALPAFLKETLQDHGFNPNHPDDASRSKVDSLCNPAFFNLINPPLGSNPFLHDLQFIYSSPERSLVSKRDEVIAMFKARINTLIITPEGWRTLEESEFIQALADLKMVEEVRRLFPKYERIIKLLAGDVIIEAELASLATKITAYFERETRTVEEELRTLITKFHVAVRKVKQDRDMNWMGNYFANFNAAEEKDRVKLGRSLSDPVIQARIRIEESWLAHLVRAGEERVAAGQPVEISHYELVRVILHALITPIAGWSSLLTTCFTLIINHIESRVSIAGGPEKAFYKSSFPEKLRKQLKCLVLYRKKLVPPADETPEQAASREREIAEEVRILNLDALEEEMTLLMSASKYGFTQVVTALLGLGAMANTRNRFNHTALMCAAVNGLTAVVEKLLTVLTPTEINIKDNSGMTALMYAAQLGYADVITELLTKLNAPELINVRNNDEATALMFAAANGHAAVVEKLLPILNTSELINIKDIFGNTALMLAAANGHAAIVEKLLTVLNTSELINIKDNAGMTALMVAASKGHTAVVEKLLTVLNTPELINIKDNSGNTALMFAAANGHAAVVEKLLPILNTPELINIKDNKGITALMFAAANGHAVVVEKLLPILNTPELINIKDNTGMTALMIAALKGHAAVVEKLLPTLNTPDLINLKNNDGFTALMLAILNKHTVIVERLLVSLKNTPDAINFKDPDGYTALMCAVQLGHTDIVEKLLTVLNTPDLINLKNNEGVTALMIAVINRRPEVVRKFLSHKDVLKNIAHEDLKAAINLLMNNAIANPVMPETKREVYRTVLNIFETTTLGDFQVTLLRACQILIPASFEAGDYKIILGCLLANYQKLRQTPQAASFFNPRWHGYSTRNQTKAVSTLIDYLFDPSKDDESLTEVEELFSKGILQVLYSRITLTRPGQLEDPPLVAPAA